MGLRTPLITTHEPPSRCVSDSRVQYALVFELGFRRPLSGAYNKDPLSKIEASLPLV